MKKEFNLSCIQLTDFVSVSTRSFKEEVALALHSFCLVTICCCCRISFLIALVFLLGSIVIAETLCPILSIVPRADLVPMCDAGRCSSVLASNAPSGFSLLMRICVLPSGWRAYQMRTHYYNFQSITISSMTILNVIKFQVLILYFH